MTIAMVRFCDSDIHWDIFIHNFSMTVIFEYVHFCQAYSLGSLLDHFYALSMGSNPESFRASIFTQHIKYSLSLSQKIRQNDSEDISRHIN